MEVEAHKERRQREIAALKVAILTAARDLAKRESWPKVSIRKIAKEIAYTPPVIYEHFKNKEAILIELSDQGFRQLKRHLDEAKAAHPDPMEALLALSEAYWAWAFDHRELYEVMFNLDGIRCSQPNKDALRETGQCVIACFSELHSFPAEVEALFFNWWALMHGHVSLILCGQLIGMSAQLKSHLKLTVERLGRSLA